MENCCTIKKIVCICKSEVCFPVQHLGNSLG